MEHAHGCPTRGDRGFSLVELLVVVVIVGILAAIAIPVFVNQRERAWIATVRSDLRNAAVAAEAYAADRDGGYAGLGEDDLSDGGYNESQGVTVSVTSADVDRYLLTGEHSSLPARSWVYDSDSGVIGET